MTSSIPVHLLGTGSRHVICLHGWFGHARGWGELPDHLDGARFTFAFMDYRGYGQRMGSDGPWTLQQIAEDTLQVADDLGWDTFGLLGHSMGGSAIQYVLAEAPQRVQCLAAIAPVPATGVPFDDDGWALFCSAEHDHQARRTILDFTTGGRRPDTWLDDMVASAAKQSRPDAVAGYLKAWARTRFEYRIRDMTVPVQVIAGRHDPALGEDVCRATWLQHYPHAQLHVIEDAGHYPMDETPAELADLLHDFLAKSMSSA